MIDFHTHKPNPLASHYIQVLNDYSDDFKIQSGFCLGTHPWEAESFNPESFEKNLIRAMSSQHFKGIGEIGLDKIKGPKLEIQLDVFKNQLDMAVKYKVKTLTIHCVKMHNEILAQISELNYKGNLILHDFHGHMQIVKQYNNLTKTYISVGKNFLKTKKNLNTIKQLGPKCVLLETDDRENNLLEEIYAELSHLLNIEQADLVKAHIDVFNSF